MVETKTCFVEESCNLLDKLSSNDVRFSLILLVFIKICVFVLNQNCKLALIQNSVFHFNFSCFFVS